MSSKKKCEVASSVKESLNLYENEICNNLKVEEKLLPQNIADLEDLRSVLLEELKYLDLNETEELKNEVAIVCQSYGSSDDDNLVVSSKAPIDTITTPLVNSQAGKRFVKGHKSKKLHNQSSTQSVDMPQSGVVQDKIQQCKKHVGYKPLKSFVQHGKYIKKRRLKSSLRLPLHQRRMQCPFSSLNKFSCQFCCSKKERHLFVRTRHQPKERGWRKRKSTKYVENSSEWSSSSSDEDVKQVSKKHKHTDKTIEPTIEESMKVTHIRSSLSTEAKLSTVDQSFEESCLSTLATSYCDLEKSSENAISVDISELKTEPDLVFSQNAVVRTDNVDCTENKFSRTIEDDALRSVDSMCDTLEDLNDIIKQQVGEAGNLQVANANTSESVDNDTLSTSTDISAGAMTSCGEKENETSSTETPEPSLTKKEKKRKRAEEKCKEKALMLLKAKELGNSGGMYITTEHITTPPCPSRLVFYDEDSSLSDENRGSMNLDRCSEEKHQVKLCDYGTDVSSSEEPCVQDSKEVSVGDQNNNVSKDQCPGNILISNPDVSREQSDELHEQQNQRSMHPFHGNDAENVDDVRNIELAQNDPECQANNIITRKEALVENSEHPNVTDTTNTAVSAIEESVDSSDSDNNPANKVLSDFLHQSTVDGKEWFIGEIMGSQSLLLQDKKVETPGNKYQSDINCPQYSKCDENREIFVQCPVSSQSTSCPDYSDADSCVNQRIPDLSLISKETKTTGSEENAEDHQKLDNEEQVLHSDAETRDGEQKNQMGLPSEVRPASCDADPDNEDTSCDTTSHEYCFPASFPQQIWIENSIIIKCLKNHVDQCLHDNLVFDQEDTVELIEDQLKSSEAVIRWVEQLPTLDYLPVKSKRALLEKRSKNTIFQEMWQAKLIYLKTGYIILKYQPVPSRLCVQETSNSDAGSLVFWKMPTLLQVQNLQTLSSKVVDYKDPDYNKSLREYASLMNDLCLVKADKGFAAEVMDQLLIYRINRERLAAKENLLSCEAELFEYVKLMCCASKAALQFLMDLEAETRTETCHDSLEDERMSFDSTCPCSETQLGTDVDLSFTERIMSDELGSESAPKQNMDSIKLNVSHVDNEAFQESEHIAHIDSPAFRDKTFLDKSTGHQAEVFNSVVSPEYQDNRFRGDRMSPTFSDVKYIKNRVNTVSNEFPLGTETISHTLDNIARREKALIAQYHQLKSTRDAFAKANNIQYNASNELKGQVIGVNFNHGNYRVKGPHVVHGSGQIEGLQPLSAMDNTVTSQVDAAQGILYVNSILSQDRSDLAPRNSFLVNYNVNSQAGVQDVRNVVCSHPRMNTQYAGMAHMNECSKPISQYSQNQCRFLRNRTTGKETNELQNTADIVANMVKERRIALEKENTRLQEYYSCQDLLRRSTNFRNINNFDNQVIPGHGRLFANPGMVAESQSSGNLYDCRNPSGSGMLRGSRTDCNFNQVPISGGQAMMQEVGVGQPPRNIGFTNISLEGINQSGRSQPLHNFFQAGSHHKSKGLCDNRLIIYSNAIDGVHSSTTPMSVFHGTSKSLENDDLVGKLEATNMSDELLIKIKQLLRQQEDRQHGTMSGGMTGTVSGCPNLANHKQKHFISSAEVPTTNRMVSNYMKGDNVQSIGLDGTHTNQLTIRSMEGRQIPYGGQLMKVNESLPNQHQTTALLDQPYGLNCQRRVLLETPTMPLSNLNASTKNKTLHVMEERMKGFPDVPVDSSITYHTGMTRNVNQNMHSNKIIPYTLLKRL